MSGTTAGSQIVLLRHGVLLENYTSSDLLIVLDRTAEIPAKIARSYIFVDEVHRDEVLGGGRGWNYPYVVRQWNVHNIHSNERSWLNRPFPLCQFENAKPH